MGAWGGYRNGRIPLAAMEYVGRGAISGEPQYLHPAAASAWRAFVADVRAQAGVGLLITEGFRPLALQQHYWNTLPFPFAATPGTSTHGWALAVDMANYARVDKELLRRLARARGFSFATGDRVREPWHIEFVGSLTTWAGSNGTPIGGGIEDDMYEQADRERDSRIEQLLADTKKSVDNTHAGIWRGGSVSIDGVARTFNYGVLPIVAHNQTLIGALTEAVKALSVGQGADPAAIERAAYEGAARALQGLTVPTAAENGAAARAAIVK